MNATDQIKHKIQSDPVYRKHAINFVHLDGTVERRISTGIVDPGLQVAGVLNWRDENGIFYLSPINNFRHIFFDEAHRDMVEAAFEEAEKRRLGQKETSGETHGG